MPNTSAVTASGWFPTADQDSDTLNALQQEQKADVLAARQRLRALPLRPRLKR
jgi:hypothetical protein